MKRILLSSLIAGTSLCYMVLAGGMNIEVSKPDANTTTANTLAVARVTACMEPAKANVKATLLQFTNGRLERTPLQTVPIFPVGTFAITGSLPPAAGVAIEIAVTNPNYPNYEPRVLLRRNDAGIEWGSMKRFFSTPPTEADVKAFLGNNGL